MKKIIYILAAAVVLLTACGGREVYVPDEAGFEVNTRHSTETTDGRKKRQERTVTETTTGTETDLLSSDSTLSGTSAVSADSSDSTDSETSQQTAEQEISENPDNSTASEETAGESSAVSSSAQGTTTTTTAVTPTTAEYYLDGIVYEIHDKYIIIKETDFDKVAVTVSDNAMLSDINIGDTVEVTYNGLINEGNVSYAYDAYSVDVTRKSEKVYKPQTFEYNGMAYSILMPEDWSSKIIEYPQEGDFTDWGVRFMPENGGGSMDISWHSAFKVTVSMTKVSKTFNNTPITEYSQSGVWKFIAFENGYVAANNFTDSSQFENYKDEMEFILSTLEFIS